MDVLFLAYTKTDACSFYRSAGVAHHLQKISGHDITCASWKDIDLDWATILNFDIIMLQRPYTRQSFELCQYIKQMNVKLWVDYDDNLFCVPPENKSSQIYNDPDVQACIKGMLAMADVVSVTTDALRDSYLQYNSNIHVIPNAFNDLVFKRPELKKRADLVVWRGTDTHIYDLMCHGVPINRITDEFKDWQFLFFGYYPWFLSESTNKGFLKGMDIILYFNNLLKLAPSVVQVPLHDNLFNRSKSNIASIEGAYAGALSIIPSWWDMPGAISYDDPDSYYEAMRSALSGEIDIQKENARSWEYIQDCLTLSKVNEMRVNLIKTLI